MPHVSTMHISGLAAPLANPLMLLHPVPYAPITSSRLPACLAKRPITLQIALNVQHFITRLQEIILVLAASILFQP